MILHFPMQWNATFKDNVSIQNKPFAVIEHVSDHWLVVQALAHTPVMNYVPQALYHDRFDQCFVTKCEPVDPASQA